LNSAKQKKKINITIKKIKHTVGPPYLEKK